VEPIHILNVAMKVEDESLNDDTRLSEKFAEFTIKNTDLLLERGIRRVTIVVLFR